jgi:hypothetical protein
MFKEKNHYCCTGNYIGYKTIKVKCASITPPKISSTDKYNPANSIRYKFNNAKSIVDKYNPAEKYHTLRYHHESIMCMYNPAKI